MPPCRLKATSAYYGDFKQAAQPFLAQVSAQPAGVAPARSGQPTAMSSETIAALIRGAVASVLGAGGVGADQPLVEAGLDSLGEDCGMPGVHASVTHQQFTEPSMHAGAVELRNEIGKAVGMELPGTLVFDYPSISAISGMLAAKLQPKQDTLLAALPARHVFCLTSTGLRVGNHAMTEGAWYVQGPSARKCNTYGTQHPLGDSSAGHEQPPARCQGRSQQQP